MFLNVVYDTAYLNGCVITKSGSVSVSNTGISVRVNKGPVYVVDALDDVNTVCPAAANVLNEAVEVIRNGLKSDILRDEELQQLELAKALIGIEHVESPVTRDDIFVVLDNDEYHRFFLYGRKLYYYSDKSTLLRAISSLMSEDNNIITLSSTEDLLRQRLVSCNNAPREFLTLVRKACGDSVLCQLHKYLLEENKSGTSV